MRDTVTSQALANVSHFCGRELVTQS